MNYVTLKRLNKSDDKRIEKFDKSCAEIIDKEKGIYGLKFVKPSKIDYFYFSEELARTQLESKNRSALKMLNEAKEIQKSLDKNSGASLKLNILNPHGRLWTMVAGGGASVIYSDTVSDMGFAKELANYGEYSGNPKEDET